MESGLFRKKSMERISSPEELNNYIRITEPNSWLMLAAFFVILFSSFFWIFGGSIPQMLTVNSVAFSVNGKATVFSYLPLSDAKRLATGMDVQLSPDYAPREQYGYIHGKIVHIGNEPVDEQALIGKYGSLSYVMGLLPEGNFVEVTIEVKQEGGNIKWSNEAGNGMALEQGAYCTSIVITDKKKPYQLIFS